MRQIGTIDVDEHAERFSDFLVAQGIGNMVEESAGPGSAWAVWVENDDHLDRARAELAQFRANPTDPKYAAGAKAETVRTEAAQAEQRRRKQFIDVRTRWANPSQVARPVTVALAVLSILASLLGTKLGLVDEPTTALENALLIAPVEPLDANRVTWDDLDAIKGGQVWRVVTPIFLHFNPLHLLFNMFWLFELGSLIEQRRRSWFLALLVIVSAAASNLAEYYLNISPEPFRQSPLFGGMSGVNYALFGYIWIKGRFQPHLGMGVSQQTVTIMIVWLFACMTGLLGPVANVAHAVGLLAGVAIAYIPYAVSRVRRRLR
jgi:GlpG protein